MDVPARGPTLVVLAALIFAGANACATAIYRRGGTIATTFLIRCAVVYVFNGLLVAKREGGTAAKDVLLLRTGCRRSSFMAAARGGTGSFLGVCLNLSFVLLTFADSFSIFKGTDTVGTIMVSRVLLGSGEKLQLRELGCSALTLVGIVLVAQPPLLFGGGGDGTARVSAVGVLVAVTAGVASGLFNVFTRALTRAGGPHDGVLTPALLLSYFMVATWLNVLLVAIIAHVSGLDELASFDWTRLRAPANVVDVLLLLVYCAGILSGQLLMAAGYKTTRAGIAAVLALTELAFSYLLGATALGEPPSVCGTLGTAVIFGSVCTLALLGRQKPPAPLAAVDAAREIEEEAALDTRHEGRQ